MNRERRIVPIIFGILILTGTSGVSFAPMSVSSADAVFTKKIIGYFPEWESGDVAQIDYSSLTHIIYFHIWPNSDGSLDTSAVDFNDLTTIRENAQSAGVKVMVAAGGWGVSNGFGPMAADDNARANFVNNISLFLEENQLDGIDIDWEPIDTETKKINQSILLADLKNALPNKIVTVAVNAERIDLFPSSADDVDWVNLMAYDMNWRQGEHSNFDDSVAALERYVGIGIPEEKLALGIPFYGRNDQAKAMTYEEIFATCNPAPSENYCNNYFFNGIDLVQQKSQYILNNNYAGVMIWNLGQDTYDASSLLNAINQVLDVPPPEPGPPIANPDNYSVQAQSVLNVGAPGVLLNDIEPDGGTMTAHLVSLPTHGSLNLNPEGDFVYTPDLDFTGIDTFSYFAMDSDGPSNTVEVTIQVNTTPSLIEETSSGYKDRNTVTSVTTSESILGVPNNLYLTSISVNPKIDVSSVTGMNLNWLRLDSQCGALGGSQSEVWWAVGDHSTTDGTVTASLPESAKSMIVSTSRISGINTQSPFGEIISGNENGLYGLCSNGMVSDNYSFDVNIQNQNSMLFGVIGASYEQNGYQHTPGLGFEEVFHKVTKFNDVGLSVVQKPNLPISQTTLDGTFSQLRDWHVIGIEIKPQGSSSVPNNPPIAVINGPTEGIEDAVIVFDGIGSTDQDNDSLTYSWNFGDGASGSGENTSHIYSWGEAFTVTLTVSDGNGGSDSATSVVTIQEVNDAPVAIAGGPYSGTINQEITFDGSNSYDPDNQDGTTLNDQPLQYTWEFDEFSDSGIVTTHSFSSTGEMTVTLTVSDGTLSDVSATTAMINDTTQEVSIQSIDPPSIVKGQSVNVTIYGIGFSTGASVTLANGSGPTPSVSNIIVIDDQTISATITVKNGGPPRESVWDVIVTNPDSSNASLVGGFSVTPN
ncbi:MAG: glycosyl hydrolase family 18 protein [Nitrosopumilaceae archaeon]|nr:glycosyl hydrolase family 18 protein [Nitrosopumilaceae archaeon]